jgi:hypothetical protein
MATYRHSGAMPLLGILLILGSGAVTACALGVVYSFANYYIPFIYFHFLFTAGLGWAIGSAVVWAAKTGKVRNTALLGAYGATFGLLGLYAAWGGDLLARGGLNRGLHAFDPTVLKHYIAFFYEKGLWTLGHAGQHGGDRVSGVFLGAVWLAEGGVIVGLAACAAWHGVSALPFCETCNCWTVSEANVQRLTHPAGPVQTMGAVIDDFKSIPNRLQRLKDGDLAALDDFDRAPPSAQAYLQLDLARCPTCQQSNFLSVFDCQHTVDKNKKMKVTKTAVVQNLIITAADVPRVRQAGRVPAESTDVQLPDFLQSLERDGKEEKTE